MEMKFVTTLAPQSIRGELEVAAYRLSFPFSSAVYIEENLLGNTDDLHKEFERLFDDTAIKLE